MGSVVKLATRSFIGVGTSLRILRMPFMFMFVSVFVFVFVDDVLYGMAW